jgi:hypothetical protein
LRSIANFVRKHRTERRGGDALQVTLNTKVADETNKSEEYLRGVHEALQEPGKTEQRLAQVVEMRYFRGLEESEITDVLGLTERCGKIGRRRVCCSVPRSIDHESLVTRTAPGQPRHTASNQNRRLAICESVLRHTLAARVALFPPEVSQSADLAMTTLAILISPHVSGRGL